MLIFLDHLEFNWIFVYYWIISLFPITFYYLWSACFTATGVEDLTGKTSKTVEGKMWSVDEINTSGEKGRIKLGSNSS